VINFKIALSVKIIAHKGKCIAILEVIEKLNSAKYCSSEWNNYKNNLEEAL